MKIFVAMTTYNGEKYIGDQLQSILNQTRSVCGVIIVDDVSTDNTVSVIRRFIESHHLTNWVCTVNEQNLGYIENFRKAIDLTGLESEADDLIFLADQDDYWVKDRVERMAAEMEKHPKIGLLNTRQKTFRDGEVPWQSNGSTIDNVIPKQIKLTPHTRFLRSLGCEMVFRQSFYNRVKQHWYKGWAHDEFLWSMAVLCGVCYKWDYVSLYRRIHENQVSGRFGHEKQKRIDYLQGVKQSSEHLLRLCEDKGMPDDVCKLFRNNVETHRLRLELIRDRKLLHAFRLLPRLRYYYAPKSYLLELSMALKG